LSISEKADITVDDKKEIDRNQNTVAIEGRKAKVLLCSQGRAIALQTWAMRILDAMQPIAKILDRVFCTRCYVASLEKQRYKIRYPQYTPSAQFIRLLEEKRMDLVDLILVKAVLFAQQASVYPLFCVIYFFEKIDPSATISLFLDFCGKFNRSNGILSPFLEVYMKKYVFLGVCFCFCTQGVFGNAEENTDVDEALGQLEELYHSNTLIDSERMLLLEQRFFYDPVFVNASRGIHNQLLQENIKWQENVEQLLQRFSFLPDIDLWKACVDEMLNIPAMNLYSYVNMPMVMYAPEAQHYQTLSEIFIEMAVKLVYLVYSLDYNDELEEAASYAIYSQYLAKFVEVCQNSQEYQSSEDVHLRQLADRQLSVDVLKKGRASSPPKPLEMEAELQDFLIDQKAAECDEFFRAWMDLYEDYFANMQFCLQQWEALCAGIEL
jgi:hypothetical protein